MEEESIVQAFGSEIPLRLAPSTTKSNLTRPLYTTSFPTHFPIHPASSPLKPSRSFALGSPLREEVDRSPQSSPVYIPRSRESASQLSRASSILSRPPHSSPSTPPKPTSTLLPALPISPPSNSRSRGSRRPSPPSTPPFHPTPFRGTPGPDDSRELVQHPWNTPGPSIAGSLVHESLRPSASPGGGLRQTGFGNPQEVQDDIFMSGHSLTRSFAQPRQSQRGASLDPPGSPRHRPSSPPRLLHTLHTPHRESYARGRRASGSNDILVDDDIVYSDVSQPFDTDDEFLRNVQRIVENDADVEDERTPSPWPGAPHENVPFVHQPSPLSRPGPSTPPKAAGGEIDRLRAARIEWDRQRQLDTESRRPEYLKRWHIGEESPLPAPAGQIVSSRAKRRPRTRRAVDQNLLALGNFLSPEDLWEARRARTTRSQDAKELERAIAAVQASIEHSHLSSSHPRKKDKFHKRSSKDGPPKSTSEADGDSTRRHRHRDKKGKGRQMTSATDIGSAIVPSGLPRGRSASLSAASSSSISDHIGRKQTPPPTTTVIPGTSVGIAVSPIKGRRIKLMRAATPDTAQAVQTRQSLADSTISSTLYRHALGSNGIIRHLPVSVPASIATSRPPNLPHLSNAQASALLNLEALGISIPVDPTVATELARINNVIDKEKTNKKRKRLIAFQDDSSGSSHDELATSTSSVSALPQSMQDHHHLRLGRLPRESPLKPAQVEGLGRMAVHPNKLERSALVSLTSIENRPVSTGSLLAPSIDDDRSLTSGLLLGGAGYNDLVRRRAPETWQNEPAPIVTFPAASPALSHQALSHALTEHGPNWPDSQFPWSLNLKDRKKWRRESNQRKMELVEKFFDRDTDDESGSDDCPGKGSDEHTGGYEGRGRLDDTALVEGARGLWALGHTEPKTTRDSKARLGQAASTDPPPPGMLAQGEDPNSMATSYDSHFVAPSDPSDARSALASRRDVRNSLWLAQRYANRQEENDDDDDGEVLCVCRGPDDGRAMVRCDGCKTWSHQICVDIQDESQLGECWYCWRCAPTSDDVGKPIQTPTLAPPQFTETVDSEVYPAGPFLRTARLQQSTSWSDILNGSSSPYSALLPPKTPKGRLLARSMGGRSSIGDWTTSALQAPFSPHGGMDSRKFQTPKFFDDIFLDAPNYAALDPTSTPSRGTKYSVPFIPTANKRLRSEGWGDMLATPRGSFPTDVSSALAPDQLGLGHSASTVQDSGGPYSPPTQHYSMHPQYLATPIQSKKSPDGLTGESPIVRNDAMNWVPQGHESNISGDTPSHA